MERGGTQAADAALGAKAWTRLSATLNLRSQWTVG